MTVKFAIVCGGIFLSFWVANLFTEKLFKSKYGTAHDKFSCVWSLQFFTTVVNTLSSFAVLRVNPVDHEVPVLYQYGIALPYLLATFCSLTALKWVSYPAQVLSKSAKPIPVLLLGVLIGKKRYHASRYVTVVLMCTGLAMFMYNGDKAAKSNIGFGVGDLLLVVALMLDGVMSSLEERLMSKQPIHPVRFMFDINVASILIVGYLFVLSGEIFDFACFVRNHPIVIVYMLGTSIFIACGQFFIFKCITDFGTLTCSIVTTSRKFFTLLSSIVIFQHVLQWAQWLGIALVFGGLLLDIYIGKFKNRRQPKETDHHQ